LAVQTPAYPGYRIGIIGCGNIFERYVTGMRAIGGVDIVWCADLDEPLAHKRAEEFGLTGGSVADALADRLGPASLVVNLTPPAAHAPVSREVLQAGKHVYVEKPLATTPAEAAEVLQLASDSGLQVGAAPDWVLSATAQAAREAITSGRIGEPVGVTAFTAHSRVEQWHPSPALFFAAGAGPVLDIGPYYVSALAYLLGPIRSVSALARIGAPQRQVTAPGRTVDVVLVEVATHVCALLDFASGTVGTLTLSFDAWEQTMPFIEVHGTEGTLSLPRPHERDGQVRLKLHSDSDWTELTPADGPYARGIGVTEMAAAISAGRPHLATGTAALHVLEVLTGLSEASSRHEIVRIASTP
jgi:predicted dehydrogenase